MEEVRNYRKSESGNLVASKDLSTGDIVLSLQPLAAGIADSQLYQKDLKDEEYIS